MRDIALPACLAIFACGHSHPRRRGNEHSGRQFASCAILAKSASRLARLIKGLRWPGIADCRVGEGHGVSPVTVCDLPPKLPPQIDGSQRNATAVPGTPARIDRATLVGTWVLQTERAGNVWNTMESGPGGSHIDDTRARRTWVSRCGHAGLPPNLPPQNGGTEWDWNPMKIQPKEQSHLSYSPLSMSQTRNTPNEYIPIANRWPTKIVNAPVITRCDCQVRKMCGSSPLAMRDSSPNSLVDPKQPVALL
jgi:hypothetical protein